MLADVRHPRPRVRAIAALRSGDDAGFGLVELIVAMIIMMIAGALASQFLVDNFQAQSKSAADRQAIDKTARASSQIERDLRAAGSPDRAPEKLGDVAVLRNALSGSATAVPVGLDPRDIVFAASDELHFRADVAPAAGVECVVYFYLPTGSGSPAGFYRQVRTYLAAANSCGATGKVVSPANLIFSEILVQAQSTAQDGSIVR